MKNLSLFFNVIVVIFLLTSCEQSSDKNPPADTPVDTLVKIPNFDFNDQSDAFKLLVKSDTAVIRGIGWSSSLSDVTKYEESKNLVEQGEDFSDYLVNLNVKEQADVLYYFNEADIVQKIELNIYPSNEESRTKLYKEFISYFTFRYGEPSSEIEEVKIWTNEASNTYVEMRMLGNSKIHDLQIDLKNLTVNENF